MHDMCEYPCRAWPPWMMLHALLWASGPGPPWARPSARAEPLEAYLPYPASYPLRCMPQRQCVLHAYACLMHAYACLILSASPPHHASHHALPYMMPCLTGHSCLPSYPAILCPTCSSCGRTLAFSRVSLLVGVVQNLHVRSIAVSSAYT
jgi:hypothetical protein